MVCTCTFEKCHFSSGQIPLHTLNLTQLSNETGLSRELVEGSIREILQTLSRAVAAKKSIEFDLKDIGRLEIDINNY